MFIRMPWPILRSLRMTPATLGLTRSAPAKLDLPETPRSAQRQPHSPTRAVGLHVAHDGPGRGNRHDGHLLRLRIECHHLPAPRLAVPDLPVGSDRDAIRPRVW